MFRKYPQPDKTDSSSFAAAALVALGLLITGCKEENQTAAAHQDPSPSQTGAVSAQLSKGVGPIATVTVGPLDTALAARGEKLFSGTCSACHKLDQRYVGPALGGVTKRRSPEWIMNMILNPSGMTQNDSVAKELLGQYLTQMSVNVSKEDARAALEFFRKHDGT